MTQDRNRAIDKSVNAVIAPRDLGRRFDAFEIHPLQAFDKYNNVIHDTHRTAVFFYGQCEEDAEDIVLWGVYGHLKVKGSGGQPIGGLENIADCSTREDAEDVMFALDMLLIKDEWIKNQHDPRVPIVPHDPRWSDDGT